NFSSSPWWARYVCRCPEETWKMVTHMAAVDRADGHPQPGHGVIIYRSICPQLRGRPRFVFCTWRSAHYRTDSVWCLSGCGRTDHAIDDTRPIRRTFSRRNYRMGWSRTDSDLRCRATTITITAYDCGHCFCPCGNANIFCFPAARGLEIIACCPHCRFDVGCCGGVGIDICGTTNRYAAKSRHLVCWLLYRRDPGP